MTAELTVDAATLAEAATEATARFLAFFGGTEWSMTILRARPSIEIRSGAGGVIAITWSVDFEAVT